MSREAMTKALEALEGLEALLLSMGLTHLIVYGDAEKAITNLQKELAQQALDKMAENARELGLDYEPAQQEPVAWIVEDQSGERLEWASDAHSCHGVPTFPLYTSPPAQRKPLTDEEIGLMYNTYLRNGGAIQRFVRAIEAAHGIKEKNT